MALTEKKRRFVDALRSGKTGKAAAIAAGYSVHGASQAASRLMNDKDVKGALERHDKISKAKEEAKAQGKTFYINSMAKTFSDPLEFLASVWNDPSQDPKLRVDSAKAGLQYYHVRKSGEGKKAQAQTKAEEIANKRFAPRPAPGIFN